MAQDGIANKTYSLQELMLSIQSVLQKTYSTRNYWIRCELARISLHVQSGHCYLELIEKSEKAIIAQMRGIIWSDKYNLILDKFKSVTDTPLTGGMKVLFSCNVSFHPLHGMSLNIVDVEPSFTLGEMAKMKNDSIIRLKAEGLYGLNRKASLPLLPYRIAIISVETSRGYLDFVTTIVNHKRKYAIRHKLFEAILQGENAVPSLTRAFSKIISDKDSFDAIAIIRGGAGDAGLACYDEYSLSAIISRSPLPVITGIGHASNETVAEMISYKNCITPTAAAGFILEKFDTQAMLLEEKVSTFSKIISTHFADNKSELVAKSERLCMYLRNKMHIHDLQLKNIYSGLPSHVSRFISEKASETNLSRQSILSLKRAGTFSILSSDLNRIRQQIETSSANILNNQNNIIRTEIQKLSLLKLNLAAKNESLSHHSEKIKLLDPINILRRGYSITRKKGKAITDASAVDAGSILETQLANGTIISVVEKK